MKRSSATLVTLVLGVGLSVACNQHRNHNARGTTAPNGANTPNGSIGATKTKTRKTHPPKAGYTLVEVVVEPTLASGCGIENPQIHFAPGATEIDARGKEELAKLAKCLDAFPLQGLPIVLMGHTDPQGKEESNRELGLRRANAVAAELERDGVSADRITTYSRGEFAVAEEKWAWPDDRRVDIRLRE